MTPERPDPDRLLESLKEQEAAAQRGKLKVFFGACPGVGKTYAMLLAARERQAEGVNLLIGVAETHGRRETLQLLDGLPLLPSRKIEYRGRVLPEFDLEAALAAAPTLIIVDELAHSNVPGSRHAKRWQDVEELLAAGIDVYTTLNVQHLESLNDIVSGITGVRVRETVADHVFDRADEVILVDLPPEELLIRLAAGKVYMPHAASQAAKNFFRKGNLIALRELALRRTADRVDEQMRAYRADQAIATVWEARERLIVCVGMGKRGEKLVREAARLASKLQADWIAVHVDDPEPSAQAQRGRRQALEVLKLAERLGAETLTIPGADVAEALTNFARVRNATKLVVGRTLRKGPSRWFSGVANQLAETHPDLDVVLIGLEKGGSKPAQPHQTVPQPWSGYLWATLACTGATLVAAGLLRFFDLANVVMLFLLTVVLVSIRFGRGPGAWASLFSVICFDFFFVEPRGSFSVHDGQYLFTFALMLLVALTIGQLAAKLRLEARVAVERERRAMALANIARQLSGALKQEQIVNITETSLAPLFDAKVTLLLPDLLDRVHPHGDHPSDEGVAQWVYDHQQEAGLGTSTLSAAKARYLPLKAPMRTRGVCALEPRHPEVFDEPEERRLLDACLAQIALALERVHFVEVAQEALVSMEGQRLRNALLAAVSHDLKTPLTAIIGLAGTLERDPSPQIRHELTSVIREEAEQMHRLVINLLEMARLQSGGTELRKEWHSIEEVVGSALHQLRLPLSRHGVRTDVPTDLPLVEFDALLIERVLVNLLENAAKYTASGSHIRISARHTGTELVVTVEDDGPGLPSKDPERLFEPFTRGGSEPALSGVGLGLALSRIIVEAHGGKIQAENRLEGGARFRFILPAGIPPEPEEE